MEQRFGKYRLIRKLATGGMAEVYLAAASAARGLQKLVVIKQVHPALASSGAFVRQFIAEAEIGLSLNHPNIVQIFDFGQVGRTYFIAMELVDGVDLMRLMRACHLRQRRVPYGLAAYICQQACLGLDYAHRKRDDFGRPLEIVHRDVSPQNLLVSRDGAVRVLDFGIARVRGAVERDGTVKGKFAYMSPEQAAGKPVDRRSDIYSLGIILCELATGRPLFSHLKGRAAIDAVRRGVVPRPTQVDAELPEALEAIILRALARAPDERFQTARDLQQALGRLIHDEAEIHDAGRLAALVAEVAPGTGDQPTDMALAEQPTADHPPSQAGSAVSPAGQRQERKQVVLISGALRGMTAATRQLGAERGRHLLLDFMRVAEHIAFKHGARVQRLDEQGLLLLLGIPLSSEEDAARAIRLGRALVDAIDGIGRELPVRPGLSVAVQRGSARLQLGQGPAGEEGIELDQGPQAIADRLIAEAMAGEILVGGGVYRLAREAYRFEALEPLPAPRELRGSATGGAARVKAYRLVGPLPLDERIAGGRDVNLVGRALELRRLRDVIGDVIARGRSRQVAVLGPTGVGKRSLVAAIVNELDADGTTIVRAAGHPSLIDEPYGLVRELLGEVLGLAPGAAPRAAKHAIGAAVARLEEIGADERAVVEATLGSLFGVLGEPVGGELDEAAPGQRQRRVVMALRHLQYQLARQRPLVVQVASLHFADRRSQSAITAMLSRQPAPVIGLLTGLGTDEVRRACQRAHAEVLELGELGPREREALVRARLVPGEGSRRLARGILKSTGGNPLFINEMLESLVERGLLRPAETEAKGQTDGPARLRWVGGKDVALKAPTTVEGVIASRIDALERAHRALLGRAAVLGSRLTQRALEQLGLGQGRERVAAGLDALVARGLLAVEDAEVRRFAFTNHIVKRLAYETLADDERSRLHQRVATRLVASPAYRPGVDDARVARHLELAGDPRTALQSYLRAAHHARANHADAEAFRLLGAALALVASGAAEARFEIHAQREAILRAWGRHRRRLREIRRLEQIARGEGDPAHQSLASNRRAALLLDVGRFDEAGAVIEGALAAARAAGDPATEAEALGLQARARQRRGDYAGALLALDAGLALCQQAPGRRERRAELLRARGDLLRERGDLRAALSAFAEALVIHHRLGHREQESRTLDRMGKAALGLGEVELTLAYYKRALRIAQDTSDRVGMAKRLLSIGHAYAELGDADHALPYLGKALQINQALGDLGASAAALVTMGQLHLRCGNRAAAQPMLEQGCRLAGEASHLYELVRGEVFLAQWALAGGDSGRALELARSARRRAASASLVAGQAHALAIEARALLACGETERALERSGEAMVLLSRQRIEGTLEAYLERVLLLRDAGRIDEARAALDRGRALVAEHAAGLRDPKWRARLLAAEPARSLLDEGLLTAL